MPTCSSSSFSWQTTSCMRLSISGLADGSEHDDTEVETDGVKLVVDSISLDLVRGAASRTKLVRVTPRG